MWEKLFKIKTDNLYIQMFRYTFVGGIAFLVDFITLYCFTEIFNIHYLISAAIAFIFGLTTNYILSIIWVFKYRKVRNKIFEFGIFALIGIVGLVLNELIIWTFTEFLAFHYLISKIFSTAIVYFWNFFARRYILYHDSRMKG